jgi:hypothetical protein
MNDLAKYPRMLSLNSYLALLLLLNGGQSSAADNGVSSHHTIHTIQNVSASNRVAQGVLLTNESGSYKVVEFDVDPVLTRASIVFEVLSTNTPSDEGIVWIDGYSKGKEVEWKHINGFHPNRPDTVNLKSDLETTDQSATIHYEVILRVPKTGLQDSTAINYRVTFLPVLIPSSLVWYALTSFLFAGVMMYVLSWKRFSLLSQYGWKGRWTDIVDGLARAMLFLLLVDEIGLFFEEWGHPVALLAWTRDLISVPGVSKMLFLANLVLVVPAAYVTLQRLLGAPTHDDAITGQTADPHERALYVNRISLVSSILVLTLSVLVTLLQCITWNEFDIQGASVYSVATWLAGAIVALPVVTLLRGLVTVRRIERESVTWSSNIHFEKTFFFAMFTVLFLTFSQTMVTKVLLLLPLINWVRERASAMIRRIPPKTYWNAEDLAPGVRTSMWELWNFVLLTSSTWVFILFWQTANGPFPPAGSLYPKTITISFLYTLFILAYFWTQSSLKSKPLRSIAWSALALVSLHGSFLVFPDWFFSSGSSRPSSILGGLVQMFGGTATSLLMLSNHILFASASVAIIAGIRLRKRLRIVHYEDVGKVRLYALLAHVAFSLVSVLYFLALFFALSRTDLFVVGFYAGRVTPELICVLAALPLVLVLKTTVFESGHELLQEVELYGTAGLAGKLLKEVRLLRILGAWNVKNLPLRLAVFVVSATIVFTLGLGILIVPLWTASCSTTINWSYQFDKPGFAIGFAREGNQLFIENLRWVLCMDRGTGRTYWQASGLLPKVTLVSDSTCVISDVNDISARRRLTGGEMWSRPVADDSGRFYTQQGHPSRVVQVLRERLAVKTGSKMDLCASESGKILYHIPEMSNPLFRFRGGPVCWIDHNGFLWSLDSVLAKRQMGKPKLPLMGLFSFAGGIWAINPDGSQFFDLRLGGRWSGRKPLVDTSGHPGLDAAVVQDSILILGCSDSHVRAISIATGRELWSRDSADYILNTEDSRWGRLSLTKDGIVCKSGEDLVGFAYDNGRLLFRLPSGAVNAVSPDMIVTIDGEYCRIFSAADGKQLYSDPYVIGMSRIGFVHMGDQASEVRPQRVILDGTGLYWVNGVGVFSARVPAYARPDGNAR